MKIANLKEKVIAFLIILVIVLFGRSIAGIYMEANKKQQTELEKINNNAKIFAKQAKMESDIAKGEVKILSKQVVELKKEVNEQNIILDEFNNNYRKNLIELKKYNNEKAYIPSNISTSEQFDFISNYKYQPY